MKVILVVPNVVFFIRPYVLEEKHCFGHIAVSIMRAEAVRSDDTLIWCDGVCITYTKVHVIQRDGALPTYTEVHGAVKCKAVPLQAWSGPEGCRRLRFPDFMTTTQDGGKVVSHKHRPPLRPGSTPGTHFS